MWRATETPTSEATTRSKNVAQESPCPPPHGSWLGASFAREWLLPLRGSGWISFKPFWLPKLCGGLLLPALQEQDCMHWVVVCIPCIV